MTEYLVRRLLLIVPVLLLISVLAFIVMEAPPGDFVTSYMMRQAEAGALFDGAGVEEGLRAMWGLDRPWYVRYLRWLGNLARGNLGYSLFWQAPVKEIIASRFVLSMSVALSATVLVWVVAFPIGVYSATRQYSLSDNAVTFIGFLGLSIPNFLLALIMMYLANRFLNVSIGGLFSQNMMLAGAYIMLISVCTVVGILLSDILLAVVDPRIRYHEESVELERQRQIDRLLGD